MAGLRSRSQQSGKVELLQPVPTTIQHGENLEVTWTIPLQVSVRLPMPATPPPAATQPPAIPSPQVNADLGEALAELRTASTRIYYDASGDRLARDAYYVGVNPRLSPPRLFRRLNKLLKTFHATQPPYKPVKYVYPWVDLHPDLKIHSIYSGKDFDPETLMREDLAVDEERARRTKELFARESAWDMAVLSEELSLLEAQLPYNCEHSVPQSWFGKLEPMRGDLHHLFACESGCNSFRGNHAYDDFADFHEDYRNECGKREQTRLEPSSLEGKGAVARATLYFLLRYPGLIAASGGELDVERLPTLLAWHEESPPGEYERHRNAAIYAIQGNRNPLIDFPGWARKINFRLGFGQ